MKEIQRSGSEQRHKESYGELREGLNGISRIEVNEGWIGDEIWTREPTPETVERLIEWFSDERK